LEATPRQSPPQVSLCFVSTRCGVLLDLSGV
jgi:hypothetical protein